MSQRLDIFVELEEPINVYGLGWYIGGANTLYEDYYLHDNGDVYNTCAPRYNAHGETISTGWYESETLANLAGRAYYNMYGLKYPYEFVGIATNNTESQIMEFE